jgi:hypothetical protein
MLWSSVGTEMAASAAPYPNRMFTLWLGFLLA